MDFCRGPNAIALPTRGREPTEYAARAFFTNAR